MPQEGMLVQIDGSQHPWLEDRGPKLTLLIAVDDATGTVAQAVFRTTEDTRGYSVLLGAWYGSGTFPWPSTATATLPSSTTPVRSRCRWKPPSSPG